MGNITFMVQIKNFRSFHCKEKETESVKPADLYYFILVLYL